MLVRTVTVTAREADGTGRKPRSAQQSGRDGRASTWSTRNECQIELLLPEFVAVQPGDVAELNPHPNQRCPSLEARAGSPDHACGSAIAYSAMSRMGDNSKSSAASGRKLTGN